MIAQALFSSERCDWNTPEEVLIPARKLGPLVLDPCSNAQSIVRADVEWRLERGENGLQRDWYSNGRHGVAWVNPPYIRRVIDIWCERMVSQSRRGVQQIGLLPARTDTEWFKNSISKADALCFWYGRLKFIGAIADTAQASLFPGEPMEPEEGEQAAPFPSVLSYFGDRRQEFKRLFKPHGLVVFP